MFFSFSFQLRINKCGVLLLYLLLLLYYMHYIARVVYTNYTIKSYNPRPKTRPVTTTKISAPLPRHSIPGRTRVYLPIHTRKNKGARVLLSYYTIIHNVHKSKVRI